jgi:cell division protease FtsH
MRKLPSSWLPKYVDDVFGITQQHFDHLPVGEMTIRERTFPIRVRADLQRAIDEQLREWDVSSFFGVQSPFHEPPSLASCLTPALQQQQTKCTPPQYEDVDIGEESPVSCLKSGLWLVSRDDTKVALLLTHVGTPFQTTGLRFEFAGENKPEVNALMDRAFRQLETSVNQAHSYRGKILSLEQSRHSYTGQSSGIRVHRLHTVEREQVILPQSTLSLLDRNVIGFMQRRQALRDRGLSTRKGLLFYGPPGTGKTHCIHYLTRALPGTTTLLITAEQVALLEEYMTLARLLQPSIVVLEDVDLIARNRDRMDSPCAESLLNKLLNHMDGLTEAADILFILTTNRPEILEPALASRPGRIDQAIEFPLPDDDGRRRLVAMYAGGVEVSASTVEVIVSKTQGVSAAFIKELMRRAYQFHLEQNANGALGIESIDAALEEMLFSGGSLNRTLLGASRARDPETCTPATEL